MSGSRVLNSPITLTLLGLLAAAGLVVAGLAIPIGDAATNPQVVPARAWSAPEGSSGAIQLAVGACSPRIVLRARTLITDLTSGEVLVHLHYVKRPTEPIAAVPVGHYRVSTLVKCDAGSTKLSQKLTVTQQTPATTIDRAEFARITPGMTRQQVATIVGYDGRAPGATGEKGTQVREYDEPTLLHFATVSYRDGKVVGSAYDAQTS